jgi:hypothetical protein
MSVEKFPTPESNPGQLTLEDFQKQIGAMTVQLMQVSKVAEHLAKENAELKDKLKEKE